MIRKLASILCLSLLATTAQAAEDIDTAALFSASLTGLDGQSVAMEKFRGRPLIVNFWARWCAPCREEIPELIRLHESVCGTPSEPGTQRVSEAQGDNAPLTRADLLVYDARQAARDRVNAAKLPQVSKERLLAGFPHLFYESDPRLIEHFLRLSAGEE